MLVFVPRNEDKLNMMTRHYVAISFPYLSQLQGCSNLCMKPEQKFSGMVSLHPVLLQCRRCFLTTLKIVTG